MKIEFEMNDKEIQDRILITIRDYVLDHNMLRSMVRNAIYEMTADAAQTVLKDHKAELAEMVVKELRQVVLESME